MSRLMVFVLSGKRKSMGRNIICAAALALILGPYIQPVKGHGSDSMPRCGDPNHPYPVGDLNHDCRVDLLDLAVLASHWLECSAPEVDVRVTDVKITIVEFVDGLFTPRQEVEKVRVGDVFYIRVKVTNVGCEKAHVLSHYAWELSPADCVDVIGYDLACLAVHPLVHGESTYLLPFCRSHAFEAKQQGLVTMSIRVVDWMGQTLCESTFPFEITADEDAQDK